MADSFKVECDQCGREVAEEAALEARDTGCVFCSHECLRAWERDTEVPCLPWIRTLFVRGFGHITQTTHKED